MKRINIKIDGMTCQACSSRIEKVLNKVDGLSDINVNSVTGVGTVDASDDVDLKQVVEKIEKTGYSVPDKTVKLNIEGMTCEACAARITKVVSKLPVKEVTINSIQNVGTVTFSEGLVTEEDLIKAVEKAGYSATVVHEGDNVVNNDVKELKSLKKDLIISTILSIPLLSAMFFHMAGVHSILSEGWFQFILATPVQFYIGRRYYKGAYNSLRGGGANMDVLIVMGTSAAYFFSVYHTIIGSMDLYYESSAVIITLILLGKYFEKRAKTRTTDAINKLLELQAKTAVVERDGKEVTIPVEDVILGDVVLVKPGEKIPVDGTIVFGSTNIDEAMITGESIPVEKTVDDEVIGSTINKNGFIKFEARKIGKDTMLSQIIKLVEDAQGHKAPVQRLADKISGIFVPVVIGIAVVTFIVTYFLKGTMDASIMNAVSVLVIACPCSLGLATPTAIMVGTGKGAELGILIKSGEYLEKAYEMNAIVFDKTGTITKGKPSVVDFKNYGVVSDDQLFSITASLEKISEHPLGEAVVKHAENKGYEIQAVENFNSITGMGIEGFVGGSKYYIGSVKLLNDKNIKFVEEDINNFQEKGETPLLIANEKDLLGIISVADEIKETSREAIEELQEMGIDVYMITGDSTRTANAIGKEIGIKNILAEVLPNEKAQKVKEIKDSGKVVGMVGDGINDAPALVESDIGFAIGTGTDIAIEASDITIINGDLRSVVTSIKLSNRTMKTIKQNLFWAFFYNTIGIPVAAFGFLNPMIAGAAMAFSSVSVVTNSLRLKKFKK